MKTFLIIILAAGVAGILGWQLAVREHPATPPVDPFVMAHRPAAAASTPATRVPKALGTGDAAPLKPDDAAAALAAQIDQLTSPQTPFGQRQALLEKLRKGGHLDEAVATLKQLAGENPGDPTLAIALGEAEIQQLRNVAEGGGDFNEIAILALQADRNFDAALTLDPTSWEGQFEKALALRGWPASMGKAPEVIQRLTTLAAQQANMPPQPEFARTYAVLGEQYATAGQTDKAIQTWQQGISQFPLDSTLQQDLSHGSNR